MRILTNDIGPYRFTSGIHFTYMYRTMHFFAENISCSFQVNLISPFLLARTDFETYFAID